MTKASENAGMGRSVVVVGAGGNIGSHLVAHLARMTAISRMTLIDRDRYEESNLWSQEISRADLGRPKVLVQARRLRRIGRTDLEIDAVHESVENLPPGQLRSDLIVACLDSRAARQQVNEIAWRLGVPWMDAGVGADGLMARVAFYEPRAENPCLECAWDQRDYAALAREYPCVGSKSQMSAAATGAPSELGALAASLQALEVRKYLSGAGGPGLAGKQILISVTHHRHFVTSYPRDPGCLRNADHEPWRSRPLGGSPRAWTMERLVHHSGLAGAPDAPLAVRVSGRRFVTRRTCLHCGLTRERLLLTPVPGRRRFPGSEPQAAGAAPPDQAGSKAGRSSGCPRCGRTMATLGMDVADELLLDPSTRRISGLSLGSLGVRVGDLLRLDSPKGSAAFEFPLPWRSPDDFPAVAAGELEERMVRRRVEGETR